MFCSLAHPRQIVVDLCHINDFLSSQLHRRGWFLLQIGKYKVMMYSDHGKSGHNELVHCFICRWALLPYFAEFWNETLKHRIKVWLVMWHCSSAGINISAYWGWTPHAVHSTFSGMFYSLTEHFELWRWLMTQIPVHLTFLTLECVFPPSNICWHFLLEQQPLNV